MKREYAKKKHGKRIKTRIFNLEGLISKDFEKDKRKSLLTSLKEENREKSR